VNDDTSSTSRTLLVDQFGWNLYNLQVFDEKDFQSLLEQLLDSSDGGKHAPAATVTTTTQQNDFLGVLGGSTVKLTVVYQHLDRKNSEWYAGLPDETKHELEKAENKDFPYYGLAKQTLSATQSNLLANLAAWSCLQHKDLLNAAFDDVPPSL